MSIYIYILFSGEVQNSTKSKSLQGFTGLPAEESLALWAHQVSSELSGVLQKMERPKRLCNMMLGYSTPRYKEMGEPCG